MRRLILALAILAGLACTAPVAAHASYGTGRAHVATAPTTESVSPGLPAGVTQIDSRTFVKTVNPCSCVSTIDGYVFSGMPYSPFVANLFGYDGSVTAVDLWSQLASRPGYVSNPPVTSISTTATVSGTVAPPGGNHTLNPNSYGTG